LYNSSSVYPLKGKHPLSNAYNNMPAAQISAGGPVYSILETICGAI